MLLERTVFPNIYNHVGQKQYTIITGARQVGKTSLLRMLFQKLKSENKAVFFITFEDQGMLDGINSDPNHIFRQVPINPKPILDGKAEKIIYLLIDEIQYAANPTHFLKYLYDIYESNVKIIATGSSAFYIDKKFTDSLAGRKRVFPLYPLSLKEFFQFQDQADFISELTLIHKKPSYQSPKWVHIQSLFFKYLQFGGYPEVVLTADEEEKKFLLNELKNAYIRRDIQESRIGKENKFYLTLQLLADQIGGLLNKNKLANTVQVDFNTINHYIYILEKCHHIHLVKPYFRNLRKELTKMPKVFFNDLGLRNALLNRLGEVPHRSDKGALLENYYFLAFRQKYQLDQIMFWRTTDKKEIDFVIEESFGRGKAFEIKWNAAQFKAKKYQLFVDSYPDFSLAALSTADFHLPTTADSAP